MLDTFYGDLSLSLSPSLPPFPPPSLPSSIPSLLPPFPPPSLPSPTRMVECVHCKRQMHTICVLHFNPIWKKGFQCDNCLKALNITRKENKYSAKRKKHNYVVHTPHLAH